MNRFLLFAAICLWPLCTRAQQLKEFFAPDAPTWKAEVISQHSRGSWLTGGGVSVIGMTAKAGYFPVNRFWVGAQGEYHNFLSSRSEGGLYARYYLWTGSLFSAFAEGGVSYGQFQGWDWDIDNETPGSPPRYESAKLNGALGLEVTLSRFISLEGVGKMGKLTNANWFQPSIQTSLNIYFGRE